MFVGKDIHNSLFYNSVNDVLMTLHKRDEIPVH